MNERLCLHFCCNFRKEALQLKLPPEVDLEFFPARCGRPPLKSEDLKLSDTEQHLVIGGCCLSALNALESPNCELHRLDNCFELVTSKSLLNYYLSRGNYLLTPGWLNVWRGQMREWGLDEASAHDFWGEALNGLVLLDTGTDDVAIALQEFAKYSGLEAEALPLGLDYFNLLVEKLMRSRLQAEVDNGRSAELNLAQRHAAERAMALELLTELSQVLSEGEVVGRIIALFEVLFGARRIFYLPLSNGKAGALRSSAIARTLSQSELTRLQNLPPKAKYQLVDDGFCLRLLHGGESVGLVLITELALPEHRDHYLNLALSIAGICGLAIRNARNYSKIEDAHDKQRLMSEVLNLFYRSDSQHDELRSTLKIIKDFTGVEALGLRLAVDGDYPYHSTLGFSDEFVESERYICARDADGAIIRDEQNQPSWECLCGMVASGRGLTIQEECFTARGSFWSNQLPTTAEALQSCYQLRGRCVREGYASHAIIPLHSSGGTLGLIQFCDHRHDFFTPGMIGYLEDLASSVTIGLERQRAEASLRTVNSELEERVRQRTAALDQSNAELRHEIEERLKVEDALRDKSWALGERLKEIRCLYTITKILEDSDLSLEAMLQQVVDAIPAGWIAPNRTFARIIYKEGEYCSLGFSASPYCIRNVIRSHRQTYGTLEICVNEPTLGSDKPFLDEELDLAAQITARLGILAERIELALVNEKIEGQLRQSQKMEAIGTLAGGIAHDFNNILTPVIGYTELCLEDCPDDSQIEHNLRQVLKAGHRAKELVSQILTFSRQTEQKHSAVILGQLVKEALKFLRATLPSTIQIKSKIGESKEQILADPIQIHQIVMNLCVNAAHAMEPHGGILEVAIDRELLTSDDQLTAVDLQPGTYMILKISDTGCGMSPEIKNRIFEPYFTTKEKGKGTGLGLAVVHGIVHSYGGHISVYSEPGQGTVFRIYLPVASQATAVVPAEDVVTPHGKQQRILIVDDEAEIGSLLAQLLERLGYRTRVFDRSPDALDEFKQHSNEYDLLISDMTMPELTGLDLTLQVHNLRPELPVVICSGFSEVLEKASLADLKICQCIAKPVMKQELALAVSNALKGSGNAPTPEAPPKTDSPKYKAKHEAPRRL